MDESQFAERIAQIRARFAAKLVDKLQQTDAALPHLAGDGTDSADAVEAAYRRFHDVCGIGRTIGFEQTGRAARILDAILIGPFRDHRGLSNDELAKLKDGLAALRIVAQTELHQRTQ
jgi:tetraacyldisaccharide-1-P 4'-kinase